MGADRAVARLAVGLLGPVELGPARGATTPVAQPQLRMLLGLLAVAAGKVVTAAALVDGVWGEEWSPRREQNLHALVYQLRRRLATAEPGAGPGRGGARLARAGVGYRLALGPDELDVAVFHDLAARGRQAARARDTAGARELFGQALGVWRGAALADAAPLCARLAGEAARLEEARLAVVEERIGCDLALGAHAETAGELASLVSEFPLRERLAALLMTALYRCGRRGEALAVYDTTRRVLAEELGLDPGPELAGLQAQVLADDPVLAAPALPVSAPVAAADVPIAAAVVPRQLSAGAGVSAGREAELKELDARRNATRAPHGGLPAPADLFVGRDGELAALSRMLAGARTRLVTLTGPPGIGKTRLAVACAAAHAGRTGCAAVFVDLAPLRDPALVIAELAQALDVEPGGSSDLIGQLASALGSEDRLVVLDNCEHLLSGTLAVGQVLAACPRLLVLATSRERLRLSAEQEFPVPPLAMPAVADVADLDSLAANPSVALLMDRACRTDPRFTLTPANAPLLASACVRLEGLPLAIELAAARLKVLTPGELVFRLGSRMEVLAGSARDAPPRQRALRNAIAWSYDLLRPGEQALFRRLSVFVGSWTLADADSVCAGAAGDVLTLVESLLDKSLIRRLPGDEQTAEFAMLESLREYAAEQLASHGESEEVRARHAAHYAALAVLFEASIGLPEERTTWPHWGRHHANLRAALDYCLGNSQDARVLPLAMALGWYHYTRGDLGHGQALVDRVLSAAADWPAGPDGGGAGAGALPGVLLVGGILAWGGGQPGRARDLLERALEHSEQRGDGRHAAMACAFLGHVARACGQWDASAEWHRRAAAGFRRGGNTQGVAWAQHDLGLLARDRGDLSGAVTLLRASLREFRELGYPWAVAWSAWGLGTALTTRGEAAEACPLLTEALRIYRELDDPRGVAQCLEALAETACELARYEAAARLLGAAAALRGRLAAPPPEADQARIAAVEQTLARSLGPEAAGRLVHAGRTMPALQAAELAMAVAAGTAPADPDRPRPVPLTRRERQVAALVASGRTNRQIGRVLGISEKTTEVHLHHVMSKLEARSRAEVAAWAATHHLSARPDPRGFPQ